MEEVEETTATSTRRVPPIRARVEEECGSV